MCHEGDSTRVFWLIRGIPSAAASRAAMFIGGFPGGMLMGGMPVGGMYMGGYPMGIPIGGLPIGVPGGGLPIGVRIVVDEHRRSDSCPRGNGRSASHATSNTMMLFHQTDRASANAILKEQRFSRGGAGLAGGGIYFAESASETDAKANSHGVVLSADVSLGRVKHINGGDSSITYSSLQREGYDSVCIHGRSSGLEYVVYNYGQVCNIQEHRR
jgi:hypothetical protein